MNCQKNFSKARFSIAIIVFALLIFGIYAAANYQPARNEVTYDEALSRLRSKEIKEVVLTNDETKLAFTSGGESILSKLSEAQKDDFIKTVSEFNFNNTKNAVTLTYLPAASNPMDRIFQIIFILFFVSPPLIVILLFLIWCELKKRNENK